MTIADYLTRRTRILFGVAFAGWLGAGVGVAVLHDRIPKGDPPWPMMIGFALFGIAWIFLMRLQCPRCEGRIFMIAGHLAQPTFFQRRRICFCPYCGVSLDEPYDKPGGTA
jgi:hypothetical protein